MSAIKAPVTLYWSANDVICDPRDVEQIALKLPNVKGSFKVEDENWAHQDFMIGIHARQKVYELLISHMPLF